MEQLTFNAFGVTAKIVFPMEDRDSVSRLLLEGFGGKYNFVHGGEESFSVRIEKEGNICTLYFNQERIYSGDKETVFSLFESTLRREIACRSNSVFVHSGVVGWNGKAILFPGYSYKGKTTLTMEFVKHGAEYYSDEYAVIREDGLVEPFPKFLSVRGIVDEKKQVNISVEELGGKVGVAPIPIGLVVLAEYKEGAKWRPKFLTKGQGLLEIISHAASFSAEPEKTLKILEKALSSAIIVKSKRGDVSSFFKEILNFKEILKVMGGGEEV